MATLYSQKHTKTENASACVIDIHVHLYYTFLLYVAQGSAAGKGKSNGSYKGRRLFTCPEGCADFVPVNHIRLRPWSRSNASDAQEHAHEKDHHWSSNNDNTNSHHLNNSRLSSHQQQQPNRHVVFQHHRPSSPPLHQPSGILPRTGESVPVVAQGQNHVRSPASPPPFQVGQRVCFPLDDSVYGGEVRFCGLLPGRSSSGMYVGVLLVSAFPAKVVFELRV